MNPLISELALYDIANTPGVAADLSHTNTTCSVKGYAGDDELAAALKGLVDSGELARIHGKYATDGDAGTKK